MAAKDHSRTAAHLIDLLLEVHEVPEHVGAAHQPGGLVGTMVGRPLIALLPLRAALLRRHAPTALQQPTRQQQPTAALGQRWRTAPGRRRSARPGRLCVAQLLAAGRPAAAALTRWSPSTKPSSPSSPESSEPFAALRAPCCCAATVTPSGDERGVARPLEELEEGVSDILWVQEAARSPHQYHTPLSLEPTKATQNP